MSIINPSAPIMVTGATGYVAGVLVKKLLEEGFTVHAAVRDPNNLAKLNYLNEIAANAPGNIKYFKADLLDEGSYAEAMQGCELVFHTASPFKVDVKSRAVEKTLLAPAKLGTRNVLEQAKQTPSVKRIVLTSSCAAIYCDNADVHKTTDGIFTEEHWNNDTSLKHHPYSYSKALAEKEAWKIHDTQSAWDLVVLNPMLVIGAGLNPHATSESYNIIKQLGDGSMKDGVPRWGFGVVDVQDVAEAHYRAGFTPEAKGRHIISGQNTDLFAMSQALLDKYGDDYPIPRHALPKWLLWLVGPWVDQHLTRRNIARNVNFPWKGDNSKSIRELGMHYRLMNESINEHFQQLVDANIIKKQPN